MAYSAADGLRSSDIDHLRHLLLEVAHPQNVPRRVGKMILRRIALKPQVNVADGVVEHHAGRDAVLPIMVTSIFLPLRRRFPRSALAGQPG